MAQKAPNLMTIESMRTSPIPTRSAYELMAQNAFSFNIWREPTKFSQMDMEEFRPPATKNLPIDDLQWRLRFHLRNRRWKTDFNDKIGHPQAGVPSCIFVCAHGHSSEHREWIAAATVPTTGSGPKRYAFANDLWMYIRDTGFGKDHINKFKAAADIIQLKDEESKQQHPNMSDGDRRWLVIYHTMEGTSQISTTKFKCSGIAFNRNMAIMPPCLRCQCMTRYKTIPKWMTAEFLRDRIADYKFDVQAKYPHQCAESFCFVMCKKKDDEKRNRLLR